MNDQKQEEIREFYSKLSEVSAELKLVSQQLIEASINNKHNREKLDQMYIKLDQMDTKIKTLEQDNYRSSGSNSALKWLAGFVFAVFLAYSSWLNTIVINAAKEIAVLTNKIEILEKKNGGYYDK